MVKKIAQKRNLAPFIASLKTNPNYHSLRYKDKIPFIRDIILSSAKPGTIRRIFIFGSYTNGMADEDSDIDICVIANNRINRSKLSLKIRINLSDHNITWCDLLVYKEGIFYNAENPEGIERTILDEGILIYG